MYVKLIEHTYQYAINTSYSIRQYSFYNKWRFELFDNYGDIGLSEDIYDYGIIPAE